MSDKQYIKCLEAVVRQNWSRFYQNMLNMTAEEADKKANERMDNFRAMYSKLDEVA